MVTRVSINLSLYFENEEDALAKMQIAEIALSQLAGYTPAGLKVSTHENVPFGEEHINLGRDLPPGTPKEDWLQSKRHQSLMKTLMPRHSHINPVKTIKQEFTTLVKALNKADSRVPVDMNSEPWVEYYNSWGSEKVVSLIRPVVTAEEVIDMLSTVIERNEAHALVVRVMPEVDSKINRGVVPSSLDYSGLI